jgi:nitrate/TMAO reductase-like tetraheme cytochrome c subunit
MTYAADEREWTKIWRKLRPIVMRLGALLMGLVIFILVCAGAAGWYTSRPEFCNSCHIMEPYYKSWQESSHKDVSCIECHFAPGVGGKLRGKMLGLVQLAKYVTASAGPRPAAEIPDASCLRSGCHDKRLLSGRVSFRVGRVTIPFDHTPHLGAIRRGKKQTIQSEMELRCTSCHSQIVQGKHMTVTPNTCFLCHFKDEPFNQGLGRCARCHQIPDQEFDLGGGVKFSHDLAYEKGVNCTSCHGDVIRGAGEVPRERCLSCHNRLGDLEQIDDHEFMHEMHVSEHKVDCLQCHLQIQHTLDQEKLAHAAADCGSCHPNHHREQTDMLLGRGGKTVHLQTNGMVRVRVECKTCHREDRDDPKGIVRKGELTKACSLCHDSETVKRFETDHAQLRAVSLPEIEAAIQRVRDALPAAQLADDRRAAVAAELSDAQHDLEFLKVGNDVHNMHYAKKLNQALVDRVSALCRELQVAVPKVALPAPPKTGK